MRDQLSAMQGQLSAMQEQSKFIGQQVELVVISEIAYLGLAELLPPVFADNVLIIVGKIVNGGRTPAWGIIRRLRVGVIEKDSAIKEPNWTDVEETDAGILLASQEFTITFPEKPINEELWRAIANASYKIVVDGELRYFDSLGGLNFYSFGATYKVNPWRALQRYQQHRREKRN
jgi:hypothetical protein